LESSKSPLSRRLLSALKERGRPSRAKIQSSIRALADFLDECKALPLPAAMNTPPPLKTGSSARQETPAKSLMSPGTTPGRGQGEDATGGAMPAGTPDGLQRAPGAERSGLTLEERLARIVSLPYKRKRSELKLDIEAENTDVQQLKSEEQALTYKLMDTLEAVDKEAEQLAGILSEVKKNSQNVGERLGATQQRVDEKILDELAKY
jgi:hypothetical protein